MTLHRAVLIKDWPINNLLVALVGTPSAIVKHWEVLPLWAVSL